MDLKYVEICVGNSKYYPHTGAKVVKFEDTTVESELKEIVNETYPIVEATGTNTYIGSTARITKLEKGTKCTLFVENNATGNCTLYINTYGAKNIKDSFGNIVNNLKANIPYNLCYNGMDFILQGKGGGGNATSDKLLIDSTATVDSGPISGSMPNQGTKTANINCGGSYIIPAGYHNGSGKVIANSLASQLSLSTLNEANQIINGIKAYNKNGILLTGTAENSNYTSGTLTNVSPSDNIVTVEMDFRPKVVVIWNDNERLSINCPTGRIGTKGLMTNITNTGFNLELDTSWTTLQYYAIG